MEHHERFTSPEEEPKRPFIVINYEDPEEPIVLFNGVASSEEEAKQLVEEANIKIDYESSERPVVIAFENPEDLAA